MIKKIFIITIPILIFLNFSGCNLIDKTEKTNTSPIKSSEEVNTDDLKLKHNLTSDEFDKVEIKYNMTEYSNKDIFENYENKKILVSLKADIEKFLNSLNFKNLELENFELIVDEYSDSIVLNFNDNKNITEQEFDILNKYICILIFSVVEDINQLELNINNIQIVNGRDYAENLILDIIKD